MVLLLVYKRYPQIQKKVCSLRLKLITKIKKIMKIILEGKDLTEALICGSSMLLKSNIKDCDL